MIALMHLRWSYALGNGDGMRTRETMLGAMELDALFRSSKGLML